VFNRMGGRRAAVAAVLFAVVLTAGAASAYAAGRVRAAVETTAPAMGAASTFSVLASATVESSGDTSITGDVGTWPGTGITGFPPGHISDGATHAADESASGARSALATAYADLRALAAGAPVVSPGDLTFDVNGGPVTPGVYAFSGSTSLSGTIQVGLSPSDDPEGVVVFLVPGNLSVVSGTKLELTGGLKSDHVFWCVDGSADLAAGTTMVGSILASQGVTVGNGALVRGKVVSLGGSVVLTAAGVDGVTAFDPGDGDGGGGGGGGGSDETSSSASGSNDTSGGTLPATGEDGPTAGMGLPLMLALAGGAAITGGFVLTRHRVR
jgi:hypothetical protein